VVSQTWRSSADDTWVRGDLPPDGIGGDAARGGFERDEYRVAEHGPGAGEDEQAEQDADERVGKRPAGSEKDHAGSDHAE
jgi:hypothetical protein